MARQFAEYVKNKREHHGDSSVVQRTAAQGALRSPKTRAGALLRGAQLPASRGLA